VSSCVWNFRGRPDALDQYRCTVRQSCVAASGAAFQFGLVPRFTPWANLCRAYGASLAFPKGSPDSGDLLWTQQKRNRFA
jgi:hypothetical protein